MSELNEVKELSPGKLAWLRFRRHRLAMVAGGVLVFLYLLAIFFIYQLSDFLKNRHTEFTATSGN